MSSSDFSAQNSYRIDRGKAVRIGLVFPCGLMYQETNRIVCKQISKQFLYNQFLSFASQGGSRLFEMILQFIISQFDLPALVVESRKFRSGSVFRFRIK